MLSHYQVIVIGAGPAGLTAATQVANQGVSVALLDEQPAPGGQIYRAIESVPEQRARQLGEEYQRGRKIVEAFKQSSADYFPNTQVWSLTQNKEVGLTYQQQSRIITADQVIIATGAMERPVPFPGWTLPGVMQAGAGQILFKSAGVVPDKGVVLAGSGPLLLLLAWQYLQVGVNIKAMLDLTPLFNHITALPKLPGALKAHHYIRKGLGYQRDLKRGGVPVRYAVSHLQAHGSDQLQSISYKQFGVKHEIETDLLLTHFGVIPHIWLTQAAGCRHFWDASQQCWRPQRDQWGNTSIDGILVVGDGAGIAGARSAEHAGNITGAQALCNLGLFDRQQRNHKVQDDRKWLKADMHIRPFLEAYYRIPANGLLVTPDDDTIVCRCEEVTAGQIRKAVAEGHRDSNQVKFLSRCGMGPCQGRQCANAVAFITSAETGQTMAETGIYRGRPPVAPLTLGQLAALSLEVVE